MGIPENLIKYFRKKEKVEEIKIPEQNIDNISNLYEKFLKIIFEYKKKDE